MRALELDSELGVFFIYLNIDWRPHVCVRNELPAPGRLPLKVAWRLGRCGWAGRP